METVILKISIFTMNNLNEMSKKKILIVLLFVAVLALAAVYFFLNRPVLSPAGKSELTSGDLTTSVSYSRPSVRGRVIFGTAEQKALQPYGQYWRLGANKATEITFNKDILFDSIPIKSGTYRIYAVPGPDQFEIFVNSELGKSGSEMPDHQFDVAKTQVPIQKQSSSVEQFTIQLSPAANGIDITFAWSDVKFIIPVRNQ
jgi:hypothetical protein